MRLRIIDADQGKHRIRILAEFEPGSLLGSEQQVHGASVVICDDKVKNIFE